MTDKKYRLSIALLKEIPMNPTIQCEYSTMGNYDKYLAKNISTTDIQKVEAVTILPQGEAYIGTIRTGQPTWAATLHNLFRVQEPIHDNSSNRAVIFTTIHNRVLALLFGYGKAMIDGDLICRDFGRRVALNVLSGNDIRSITSFSISDAIILSQTQASDARQSTEFGIDSYSGIVKQIAGKPAAEKYGISVAGSDILSVDMLLEHDSHLSDKLELLLSAYTNDDNRQASLKWIDQLSEVKDSGQKDHLDGILCKHISGKAQDSGVSVNNLSAAPPMIIDWENTGLFFLGTKAKATKCYGDCGMMQYQPHIDIENYIESCKGSTDIRAKLHRDHLYSLSSSENDPLSICSAYRALVCEISCAQQAFVLIDGKWFEVAASLFSEINQYLTSSELEHVDLNFPDCIKTDSNKYENEASYNQRVASALNYINFDRSHLGINQGPKVIEACDLFDGIQKRFIHVKKGGSSSMLSHLFAQGAIAAQCYSDDPDFRYQFNQYVPNDMFNQLDKPREMEFCVTYAIIIEKFDGAHIPEPSRPHERLKLLPFFSRLNLMQRTRELRRMGYRVQLGFIGSQR